jgi:WD40 repeat protein
MARISQSEVWLRDLAGRSKATARLPLEFAGKPNAVAFAPDGVHLAVGGAGGELKVWSCDRKRATFAFATGSPVLQLGWRRNSRRVAALHDGGEVTIWDLQTIPRAASRVSVSDAVPAKLDHLRICLATEAWDEYHAVLRDVHSLNLNERQTALLAAIRAEVKRRTESALKAALDPKQKPALNDPALYQQQLRRVVAMDRGVDYPHAATLLDESIRKRGDYRHPS